MPALPKWALALDFRGDGAHDDDHMNEIMDEALMQYKTRLLLDNMEEPFELLVEALQRIAAAGETFAKKCQPLELKLPVSYVVSTPCYYSELALTSSLKERFPIRGGL